MNTATKSDARKVKIGVDVFEDAADEAMAVSVRVTGETLHVMLSDGREISYPLSSRWMQWLAKAAPEQRANWRIEPGGWAIYWPDLDDGIEVAHLLSANPIC